MTRLEATAPPTSPKQRRLRRIWILLIAIGAIAGIATALIDSRSSGAGHARLSQPLLSDAPISPLAAVIFLAALVLTAIISVLYYRTIDEHDRSTQEYASLVGLNTYGFLFFSWGIAAKGNFAPPVNHGAVFVAVMMTFLVTLLWRRYR